MSRQEALEVAVRRLCETLIPFQRLLGFSLVSVAPAALRFDIRKDLVGHPVYGRLHGGVVSTALDSIGGVAMMVAVADKFPDESIDHIMSHRFARLGTIDLRTDFLRPGLGKTFVATAEVTRLGGRVGSCLTRLVNEEGVLIATGSAAYILT